LKEMVEDQTVAKTVHMIAIYVFTSSKIAYNENGLPVKTAISSMRLKIKGNTKLVLVIQNIFCSLL